MPKRKTQVDDATAVIVRVTSLGAVCRRSVDARCQIAPIAPTGGPRDQRPLGDFPTASSTASPRTALTAFASPAFKFGIVCPSSVEPTMDAVSRLPCRHGGLDLSDAPGLVEERLRAGCRAGGR